MAQIQTYNEWGDKKAVVEGCVVETFGAADFRGDKFICFGVVEDESSKITYRVRCDAHGNYQEGDAPLRRYSQ
ncbi:hypothetical protein KC851_01330 [Candidatus Kaiserbacteria bacterium]|nr:hypothetical protein [Candidatus Kaiserbacteria bacterium]